MSSPRQSTRVPLSRVSLGGMQMEMIHCESSLRAQNMMKCIPSASEAGIRGTHSNIFAKGQKSTLIGLASDQNQQRGGPVELRDSIFAGSS